MISFYKTALNFKYASIQRKRVIGSTCISTLFVFNYLKYIFFLNNLNFFISCFIIKQNNSIKYISKLPQENLVGCMRPLQKEYICIGSIFV